MCGFVNINQLQGLAMGLSVLNGFLECALVVQSQIVSKPEKRGAHLLKIKAQLVAGWGVCGIALGGFSAAGLRGV